MFTGIIQAIAKIERQQSKPQGLFLAIAKPKNWKIKLGDSIAANGVCLTVKKVSAKNYLAELMPETLAKTTFGRKVPAQVNLEMSLKLSDLLGGHLVLGHADAVGSIKSITKRGQSKIYQINFPAEFAKLLAPKGSIAIDGVSLTVVEVKQNWLSVSLVDYTLRHTTLGGKRLGDIVNLEFDVLAKYIARQLNQKGK